mgnify:CR=1 FL=1
MGLRKKIDLAQGASFSCTGFQYLKILLSALATSGDESVLLMMLIIQNEHLYGQPKLVYRAANGEESVSFDHECQPAVLYFLILLGSSLTLS